MTRLFRDDNQIPIDRVFVPSTSRNLAVGATATRTTADFTTGATVIRLVSTVPCYVAFGMTGMTVTTNDMLLPDGVECLVALPAGSPRLGVLRATSMDGLLGVTEMR